MKILVAEDDKFLIKVYQAKLSKAGYEVQVALDGEEFEEKIKSFLPDIILLDLIMPKKNGFEVLKSLKSSEKYKNIPVIVTSNLSQLQDKQKAIALGAKDYIVKSDVPIQRIVEILNNYSSK